MSSIRTMNLRGFLREFRDINSNRVADRTFMFVLGAGASVSSQIPTADVLARKWVEEIFENEGKSGESLEEWIARPGGLGITGYAFAKAAEYYTQIFQRRFRHDPTDGYVALEVAMEDARPNIGYSVLAHILGETRHKAVVTTNFDNLVADALSVYGKTAPLVCGHESLTRYIGKGLRRPLVAKVHRDLLLDPRNTPKEIDKLPDEWKSALRELFAQYTPLFIGYGGNDGGLMNFLKEELPKIKHGFYWFHLNDPPSNPAIQSAMQRHNGCFVKILGFDHFMIELSNALKFPFLHQTLGERAQAQQKEYEQEFQRFSGELARDTAKSPDAQEGLQALQQAISETAQRERENWFAWEMRAKAASTDDERDKIYRQGTDALPTSAPLLGNYATFLTSIRMDHDQAEAYFKRAIEADPKNAINLGNYANFLTEIRKAHDQAEAYYRRAVEADPKYAIHLGNYANFLQSIRKDYEQAEAYYKRAVEADPKNAIHLGNYANFLQNIRKDYEQAEAYYKRALEADPNHANNLGNYAGFLIARGRYQEAKGYLTQAWQAADKQPNQLLAEIAFYVCLLERIDGAPDDDALQRLKSLTASGYRRSPWDLAPHLEAARAALGTDYPHYEGLAAAVVDESKVAALDAWERWQGLQPIPVDTPWEIWGEKS